MTDVPSENRRSRGRQRRAPEGAHGIAAGRQARRRTRPDVRQEQAYRDADFGRVRNQQLMKALARTLHVSARSFAVAAVATAGDHADRHLRRTLLRLATGVMVARPMDISSATLTGEWSSAAGRGRPRAQGRPADCHGAGDRGFAPADISVTVLNGTASQGQRQAGPPVGAARFRGVGDRQYRIRQVTETPRYSFLPTRKTSGFGSSSPFPTHASPMDLFPHNVPTDALIIIGRD